MAQAMNEDNWEEMILEMAEKNPAMAKKMAEYHQSGFADMLENPEKYVQ